MEGVGQLIFDIVLSLLSWMVDEECERISIAQREGIEIAKNNGKYKGRKVKYHKNTTGKDKIIFDEVVEFLNNHTSIMDIHRKTGLSRNTIYKIKRQTNHVYET